MRVGMKFYVGVLFLGFVATCAFYIAAAYHGNFLADQTCAIFPWLCQFPHRAFVLAAVAAVAVMMAVAVHEHRV